MPSTPPEPERPVPHRDNIAPAAFPPPGATRPSWQQPAPYTVIPAGPRPLPSVPIIWLNIVVFGWFLGIGLIYGIVRSIQGMSTSRALRGR